MGGNAQLLHVIRTDHFPHWIFVRSRVFSGASNSIAACDGRDEAAKRLEADVWYGDRSRFAGCDGAGTGTVCLEAVSLCLAGREILRDESGHSYSNDPRYLPKDELST